MHLHNTIAPKFKAGKFPAFFQSLHLHIVLAAPALGKLDHRSAVLFPDKQPKQIFTVCEPR